MALKEGTKETVLSAEDELTNDLAISLGGESGDETINVSDPDAGTTQPKTDIVPPESSEAKMSVEDLNKTNKPVEHAVDLPDEPKTNDDWKRMRLRTKELEEKQPKNEDWQKDINELKEV